MLDTTFFTVAIALTLNGEPMIIETFNSKAECEQVRAYLERKHREANGPAAETIVSGRLRESTGQFDLDPEVVREEAQKLLAVECHTTTFETSQ